jgi:uncharacterized membrane-anchored protein
MFSMQGLNPHPLRLELHNEVHARPPEATSAPMHVSHIVMLCDAAQREASRSHIATLARERHLPVPDAGSTHLRLDLGGFRLRWELHTEFVSWTFTRSCGSDVLATAAPPTALDAVPQAWLSGLPGTGLVGLHVWVLPTQSAPRLVKDLLLEESLVASTVADGLAEVFTDFVVHPDGFSRMLLLAGGLTPRRLGRLLQGLLEIETYRMAALLGLPAAREASAVLASAEVELAELADAIRSATRADEPALLDRLTRLAGQVESQHATTHSRLSASAAYFSLVDRRIEDLGESRLAGVQTVGEFMDRRLTPARSTCEWSGKRQDALSQRVSRISNLLRTRVEIEQQQSSQDLLAAMNQRQGVQLKMQSAVEGLSVAAITYYIVGLISYLSKGAQHVGWPWSPELTAAVAIPLVAGAVWWSMRRLHAKVFKH